MSNGGFKWRLDNDGLTPKQAAFVRNYYFGVKDKEGNLRRYHGTLSAIKAGYSPNSAREIASENLSKPNVKRYIERKMKEAAEKLGITPEYLLGKLKIGVDRSIPAEIADIFAESVSKEEAMAKLKAFDVKAGVSCINEINKMVGNHAPEQKENTHRLEGMEKLIDECKKEF